MNSQLKPEHDEIVNNYLESIKNKQVDSYMLTIARDGETPVRSILFFGNAIEASEAYNMYNDWGFAKQYLTVRLYEPSGKINEKIFKRNQAGDPTFLRQNYIDMANILNTLKPFIENKIYRDTCLKVAESFAKDNWRFDPDRFLKEVGIPEIILE